MSNATIPTDEQIINAAKSKANDVSLGYMNAKRTYFAKGAKWMRGQMEEYARLKSNEDNAELIEALREANNELVFHNWHNSTTGRKIQYLLGKHSK